MFRFTSTLATLSAAVLFCACAASTTAAQAREVVIDPQTGEFIVPQPDAAAAAPPRAASKTDSAQPVRKYAGRSGIAVYKLGPQHQTPLRATLDGTGQPHVEHTEVAQ